MQTERTSPIVTMRTTLRLRWSAHSIGGGRSLLRRRCKSVRMGWKLELAGLAGNHPSHLGPSGIERGCCESFVRWTRGPWWWRLSYTRCLCCGSDTFDVGHINKCTFIYDSTMDALRSWFAARGGSFHPLVVLESQGPARFRECATAF